MFAILLIALFSFAQCIESEELESSNGSSVIFQPENVADAVNQFGYKLMLTMMKQGNDQNIVISPTSVAGLLAMTLLGTVGKTHQELAGVLGFSQDIMESRKTHEQFGDLLQSLNTNGNTSKTLYADAMFVDTGASVRDLYSSYLSRVYKGEVRSVDFSRTVEVKDAVNQWVESHTEGKIENFLQEPLPAATKAVLLSALYFRGQWQTPFVEAYTAKKPFTKPSGDQVVADLMLNYGKFKYIFSIDDDMHMIALPYNDSMTTMYALMPHVPKSQCCLTLPDLMTRLNYSRINQLIDKMEIADSVIRIPKMDLNNNAKLENPLKALGVQTLFKAGQANFALMMDSNTVPNKTEVEILSRLHEDARGWKDVLESLPNPGLHVDSVLHDVKLKIDEYGTEAVAATSGVLARSAKFFGADTPFFMFIRNEKTKLITFSAVINDPTAA